MKFCPNCNSQLSDDAKFCTGCGAHLSNDTASGMQQPFTQQTAPVMEEIVPPVIDDNTFQQPLSAPAQPVVQQSIQGGFQQPQDLRQTFDTQAQFQPRQGFASQQPYSYDNSPLGQSYAQAPIEPGFTQPGQNMEQQTPDYVNPAAPSMPGTVPGKKGGSLIVPIILIILILAVILIDVFWLFKKQIWGDDSSSSTSAASYSAFLDEGQTY